jgi:two-component system, NarL family, response regulator NreC
VTTIDGLNCDLGAVATTVLADNHALARSALRMLLESEAGLEVVAEAGDVEETLRKVRAYKPNVLVLDLCMPGGSSLAAIPTLLEASPSTAIVVLTMRGEPAFARQALRSGAARLRAQGGGRYRARGGGACCGQVD